tara:strand:+ start:1046 stop:1594 length:549 start_codon:yes stop_codon:yes gene_type:complete
MENYFLQKNFLGSEEAKSYSKKMFSALSSGEAYHDEQCPLSESFYNLEAFEELKEKVRKFIETKININLVSTFTYSRIYRNGEILKKHIDRKACEYSATLTLDYSGNNPWNFFIKDSNEISIEIDRGDILIYKGMEIPHWREKLVDDWQTQVFLHYTPIEKDEIKKQEELNKVFLNLYNKSR